MHTGEKIVSESEKKTQNIVVASVLTVMFLAAIDNMITSTILPSVISSIGGLSLYPWVVSIFSFTSTVTLPLYGKLSDIYGHKSFTIIAISIFLLGSALCGFAQNMVQLIIFRAIQGMGAGGLLTMSFIMFGLLFPAEKRAKMQGLLSSMWAVASIVGPILGAFFVEVLNWRWAFFINLPIGITSAILISKYFKLDYELPKRHYVDYKGIFLFATGILTLLYSLLEIAQGSITYIQYILLPVSIILLTYLYFYEKTVPEPILPVSQFGNKSFRLSLFLNFVAAFCLFSTINFMSLYVQGVMGGSPKNVGQILMAFSFGWVAGSNICGRIFHMVGMKKLVVGGSLIMSIGFLFLNMINTDASLWLITLIITLPGIGMGIIATGTLVSAQISVSKSELGVATSGVQLFRSIGGTIGISVLGGIQLGYFKKYISEHSTGVSDSISVFLAEPHKILDPISRAHLPADALHALSSSLSDSIHQVFIIAFVSSLIGIYLSISLPNKIKT